MSAERLDGKLAAQALLTEVKACVEGWLRAGRRPPGLAVVLVGEDPASEVYVRRKADQAAALGLASWTHRLPASASTQEVVALLRHLAVDPAVDGLLLQLPLPPQVDARLVMAEIPPAKDVDGFLPASLGALVRGEADWAACTPAGVMHLLRHHGVPIAGQRAVVVGRSVTVGKPMALLLLAADATVTIAHSKSPDLVGLTREADLLVVAMGKPLAIGPRHVKAGAVVVDVGIHRGADGRLCGDVQPEVGEVASWLSPVPGGVGATTIAALMATTCLAHAKAEGLPRPNFTHLP